MLSLDGKVVDDHIPNFISAICLMFGTYYCLNIHYPVDLGSTLEVFLHDQSGEGHKSWNKEEQETAVSEPKSPHPQRRSRWPGLERDMLKMDLSNWTVVWPHSASCINWYETVYTRAANDHHFQYSFFSVNLRVLTLIADLADQDWRGTC